MTGSGQTRGRPGVRVVGQVARDRQDVVWLEEIDVTEPRLHVLRCPSHGAANRDSKH